MIIVKEKINPFFYKEIEYGPKYSFFMSEETILGEVNIKNDYSHDLFVSLLSKFKYTSGFIFNCKISNQNYNLDKGLKKQEKLIRQLASITDNIDLGINQRGEITKLHNYLEIIEKWNTLKVPLKEKHRGKLANAYLVAIDQKICNKVKLIDDLKQYRLFGFLFNALLAVPFQEQRIITRVRIFKNVIHSLPIKVNETIKLVKDDNETNELEYHLGGSLLPFEDRTLERISNYFKYYEIGRGSLALFKYKGICKINKLTAWLNEASLSIELTNDQGYIRKLYFNIKVK